MENDFNGARGAFQGNRWGLANRRRTVMRRLWMSSAQTGICQKIRHFVTKYYKNR